MELHCPALLPVQHSTRPTVSDASASAGTPRGVVRAFVLLCGRPWWPPRICHGAAPGLQQLSWAHHEARARLQARPSTPTGRRSRRRWARARRVRRGRRGRSGRLPAAARGRSAWAPRRAPRRCWRWTARWSAWAPAARAAPWHGARPRPCTGDFRAASFPPSPFFLGCRGEGRQVLRWSDRSASTRRAVRPRSEACSRTAGPRGGGECRRAFDGALLAWEATADQHARACQGLQMRPRHAWALRLRCGGVRARRIARPRARRAADAARARAGCAS